MPRTTNAHYLVICHRLTKLWQEDRGVYAARSPQDPRYIYDYYRPSEVLTDKQRLAHRKAITKAHPALPASAARALNRRFEPVPVMSGTGKREHRVTVRAVLNPQPDAKRLARVISAMADEMARAEAKTAQEARPRRPRS